MTDYAYALWYLSIFLSLIILFILMAIYETYCVKPRQRIERVEEGPVYNEKPSSPTPSYTQFAPPSYSVAVSKMKTRVYLVSSNYEVFFPYRNQTSGSTSTTPSSQLPEVHASRGTSSGTLAGPTAVRTVEGLEDDKR